MRKPFLNYSSQKVKFKRCILFIFLMINVYSYGQMPIWTVETARTSPKGQTELGIFQYSRRGITNSIELFAHPVAFFVIPHLYSKINWYNHPAEPSKGFFSSRQWFISSVHGVNYPTLALKIDQKKEILDLVSDDTNVSNVFAFRNELLISTWLKPKTSCEAADYLFTIKLGVKVATPKVDTTFSYIERPILFRETAIYKKNLMWYVGLDLDGWINDFLNYKVDVDFYSVGLAVEQIAVEHKGLIYWRMGKKKQFLMLLGYKTGIGTYPNDSYKFIYPLIDLVWTIKPKKTGKSLFDKGIYNPYQGPIKD